MQRHSAALCGIALALASGGMYSGAVRAQPQAASCDALLPPTRAVSGQPVGPSSCRMQDTDVTIDGRTFRRLDIGLDGTVEGYLTKNRRLQGVPDQRARSRVSADGRRRASDSLAVADYERDKGAAMTSSIPRDSSAWNGKVWVTAHGRGASFKEGNLKRVGQEPRSRRARRAISTNTTC